jgi:hypothetical protein
MFYYSIPPIGFNPINITIGEGYNFPGVLLDEDAGSDFIGK